MIALFIAERAWAGIGIVGSVLLFIGHMFATTRYTVNGASLQIVCGFFYSATIDIRKIKSVRPTNNIAGSPATSLDRMEILCSNKERIIISPKNKQGFLDHLRRINPDIEITTKKTD
jgi:hypothetical protein